MAYRQRYKYYKLTIGGFFMIKLIKIFLSVLCIMTIVTGCSNTEQNNVSTAENNTNTTENDNIEQETSENESITNTKENKSKVLVAYFSATGTTKKVAETMADVLSADLYEIAPKEPYTDADLDYNNNDSRSSIEMNDDSSRPEFLSNFNNMSNYDIVFLGYPIWWSEAPHIIYTFIESYDFSGKTIIPFCTSASSGIGSSAEDVHSSVSDGGIWLNGNRLNGNSSREDISKWIESLGLEIEIK